MYSKVSESSSTNLPKLLSLLLIIVPFKIVLFRVYASGLTSLVLLVLTFWSYTKTYSEFS